MTFKKLFRFLLMILFTPLAIVWLACWAFLLWLAIEDNDEFRGDLAEMKHTRYFQWLTLK